MLDHPYTTEAVARARAGALQWLKDNGEGFPCSWEQEAADDKRRGYVMYDSYDFEAPPIAGFEALEREGIAVRYDKVTAKSKERVCFKLAIKSSA
jgi:hypothetical protein